MRKVVPCPATQWTVISPPSEVTSQWQMARPRLALTDALVGDDDVASAGDLHDLIQILDELQKLVITAESVVSRDDLVE
jgi:hypothetical protein